MYNTIIEIKYDNKSSLLFREEGKNVIEKTFWNRKINPSMNKVLKNLGFER